MDSEHRDEGASGYEREVLAVLGYEFSEADRAACERKVKRRLREKALGPFDTNRIAVLRRLKEEVRLEIDSHRASAFFQGGEGRYTRPDHWDMEALCRHLGARYPEVSEEAVRWFVPWAIYIYYLR